MNREQGNFIVAAAFFMFIFLGIAALGIDTSRYLMLERQVHSITTGAAMAGAQSLNKYSDSPDTSVVYDRILNYIERNQGHEYRDLYDVQDPHDVENITVHKLPHQPGYEIGLVGFGMMEPYFWPRGLRDKAAFEIVKTAAVRVTPDTLYQIIDIEMDCGLYADGVINIDGNNLEARDTNFCGNSDILAGDSNNGTMGDIHTLESRSVTEPGGDNGKVQKFPPPRKSIPELTLDDPGDYEVNLENFSTWIPTGECSSGGRGTTKALRAEIGGSLVIEWSRGSGDPVCVTKMPDGEYVIEGNNNGQIQYKTGRATSIYADGPVRFEGNGNGIDGALYAEGNIVVEGNNYEFMGETSTLGGLALWSEGDIDIQKNNTTVEGIMGAEGSISYGSSGGGTGPILRGVLASHGRFDMLSNSNHATIDHDTGKYDPSVLTNTDWAYEEHVGLNRPDYSNIKITRIQ